MKVGSLFAGIGGFDLGLERAGMEIAWQVEIDPWCRRVLAKHWPDVPRYEDVREVGAHNLEEVDVICGGFPCQDISIAGKGKGITGERSGLWSEYARIINELRPRYIIVENVPMLTRRGLDVVLGQMAESGYDAEWQCISASAVGAPHKRDRIWIVAYPNGMGCQQGPIFRRVVPDADRLCEGPTEGWAQQQQGTGRASTVAHPAGCGRERGSETVRLHKTKGGKRTSQPARGDSGEPKKLANPNSERLEGLRSQLKSIQEQKAGRPTGCSDEEDRSNWWIVEPDVGRVANGVPHRVDRLRGLGNAVVPQVVEWIGNRIMEKQ